MLVIKLRHFINNVLKSKDLNKFCNFQVLINLFMKYKGQVLTLPHGPKLIPRLVDRDS